jgi:exodeoxyribonuclease-5
VSETDVQNRDWSPQQVAALTSIKAWLRDPSAPQVYRLDGYAGTGKTTLAIEIYQLCNALACAFTGKAASVMASKGLTNARTIHSLIYNPMDKDGKQIRELETELGLLEKVSKPTKSLVQRMEAVRRALREAKDNEHKPQFVLKEASDIQLADLVICDEHSMLDQRMGEDLLSFGTKVLAIGDPAQLPPVNGAGFFSGTEPDFLLTEIHRQAAGNPIIRLATAIREGRPFTKGQWGPLRICDSITAEEALAHDQVLVGTNARRRAINLRHRQLRGHLDGGPMPQAGEKLVCLRNNRELGILNGTLWRAAETAEWEPGEDSVLLRLRPDGMDQGLPLSFPAQACIFLDEDSRPSWSGGEWFTYGEALTVHKSQGSSWSSVLMFGSDWRREGWKAWCYTGVTRASESLTLVVD